MIELDCYDLKHCPGECPDAGWDGCSANPSRRLERRPSPLAGLLERLERLEEAARVRARKRGTLAGFGADIGEACAYKNAAAMVANLLAAMEGGEA